MPLLPLLFLTACVQVDESSLPVVDVTHDDTVVTSSCRLRFPSEPIADEGEPGVVQIRGKDLVVICEGTLAGAPESTPWDRLEGVGVAIQGRRLKVTGGAVRGYKVGIQAIDLKFSEITGWDVSDNYRQRLASTPEREDPSDWLDPRSNKDDEWSRKYGAGLHLKGCDAVTVTGCRARRIQNGLILDLTQSCVVENNDFSYLSGWGVAMWRGLENVIRNNRLDFCVRGYSHGVYNRGQDSAGILMFEQCSRNLVTLNSVTHCGDGVFAYSGASTTGEIPPPIPDFNYKRRGNTNNRYHKNDLSFAAAHGLESTFSFGARVTQNLFEGNSICGVWGGYSQTMDLRGNRFLENGDAGYGSERGGINIEHGTGHTIAGNEFKKNAVGIRLWWDEDEHLAELPWVKENGAMSGDYRIVGNRFFDSKLGIELDKAGKVHLDKNRFIRVTEEVIRDASSPDFDPTERIFSFLPTGPAKPIAKGVRGREHIVITPYGPWDGETPELLSMDGEGRWRLLLPAARLASLEADLRVARVRFGSGKTTAVPIDERGYFEVAVSTPGFHPYEVRVAIDDGTELVERGVVQSLAWQVRAFATSEDPRQRPDLWRANAEAATPTTLPTLDLVFGNGSPAAHGLGLEASDHFGILAEAEIELGLGGWILDTTSDDGIRVYLDDELVIDDWSWHAPKVLQYPFKVTSERKVRLRVEHFELDGFAQLSVALRPTDS